MGERWWITSDARFFPAKVAGALRVLETELRQELEGENRAQALRALRRELRRIADQARAFADRNGLSVESVPDAPPAGASVEQCIAGLRRLEAALRRLARNATR
jgi:Ni,Fe-hydrogenase III large subunit